MTNLLDKIHDLLYYLNSTYECTLQAKEVLLWAKAENV